MVQKEMPNRHLFSLLLSMKRTTTLEERTLAVIELAKEYQQKRNNFLLALDTARYGKRLPDVPARDITGKRTETTLKHRCWFFQNNLFNVITVETCILKYPLKMIWAYENLKISWAKEVDKLMLEKCGISTDWKCRW